MRALVRTLLLSAAHVARHHADLLDNSLFRQHVVFIGVVLHRVMCIMPVAVSATSCPDCRTPSPRPQAQLSPASLSGSTLHHAQRRTSRLSIGSVQRRLITDCQWWAGGGVPCRPWHQDRAFSCACSRVFGPLRRRRQTPSCAPSTVPRHGAGSALGGRLDSRKRNTVFVNF